MDWARLTHVISAFTFVSGNTQAKGPTQVQRPVGSYRHNIWKLCQTATLLFNLFLCCMHRRQCIQAICCMHGICLYDCYAFFWSQNNSHPWVRRRSGSRCKPIIIPCMYTCVRHVNIMSYKSQNNLEIGASGGVGLQCWACFVRACTNNTYNRVKQIGVMSSLNL